MKKKGENGFEEGASSRETITRERRVRRDLRRELLVGRESHEREG